MIHSRTPLPSRDIPPALEHDVPVSSTSRFPISSIRHDPPRTSSAHPPPHPPRPIYPRHDPLYILTPSPPPPPPRSCDAYPDILPAPSVAPGVLADGVLTAKLPSVRQFLDAATIAPPECPPLPEDKRVLALVALSVFYRPLHPAHWTFWNREQRAATAQLVQSILNTTPTPILPPIAWIDVPESLWILRNVQNAYAPSLALLSWYATYTPAEPENRMSLRKRKPPTINPATTNADETIDEDERLTPPPRKRARTRKSGAARSASSRAKSAANGDIADQENKRGDQPEAPEAIDATLLLAPDAAPTLTKAAKCERIESSDAVVLASGSGDSVRPDPPDVEEAPEPRKSLRQRERKAKAASSASPATVVSSLTPSVRARGLSRASRESSAVIPESVGGESGSSTAVSLCEEEGTKAKVTKTVVEEVVDEDEAEEDEEGPAAKKPRASRPRAKSGSRARTTKNKTDTADETKTNMAVQARPKARSRAKSRRR